MRVPIVLAVILATGAHAETALTQGAPLAEGIDAFPRRTATNTQATAINTRLAAMETYPLQDLLQCDGNRRVTTPYIGIEFLSLIDASDGMCAGAAHPFHHQAPITFDLTTGAEVVWADLLPKAFLDPMAEEYDPTYPLRSAAQEQAYLHARATQSPPDRDCTEALDFSSPLDFDYWLDRERQSLAMAPNGLPYASTACGDTVYLSVPYLSKLDTPSRLIEALAATP